MPLKPVALKAEFARRTFLSNIPRSICLANAILGYPILAIVAPRESTNATAGVIGGADYENDPALVVRLAAGPRISTTLG
jgi:hypothetical protein